MKRTGDTWVNESGDDLVRLHHQEMFDGGDYSVTARLSDNDILLATSSGRSFLLPQAEALLLYKAIAKRWPLDALGQV